MARDPYVYFRVEAREIVDQLGQGLLDLEKGPDPEIVARLLRLAHTLKGAARVVKQREIADQVHAIEDDLAPFRASPSSVPREQIDAVLARLDDIGHRVAALAPPSPDAPVASATQPEPPRPLRADLEEVAAVLDGVAAAHGELGLVRRSLGTVQRARPLADLLGADLVVPLLTGTAPAGAGAAREKTRAVAEALGTLFDQLEQDLITGIDRLDRELGHVREAAEQLRLVPAGTLFMGLERTARDAAHALGRRVSFEGRGGGVRVDARVIATVQGALVQIVRNAVAHGIESEQTRTAQGKPPEGRVTVDVSRRGRRIVFSSADDGRGVDWDAVRRNARRKGLLAADGSTEAPADLFRILLKGGISTSRTVTEVAGRGVGLDVVREAAERLGGEVNISSRPGSGTTVELMVPLSLASIEVLIVEADGLTAMIPIDAVTSTRRIASEDLTRTSDGTTVVHDGRILPFLPLSHALSGNRTRGRGVRAWSIIVVRGADGEAGIGVDRLLGTAAVVFRPLPALAPATPVVAGATLDVDGRPQLVLDPDALVAESRRTAHRETMPDTPRLPILIVDDSLTTRMLEQSILESAGYEVDMATSAEDALEKARSRRYALFLVDVEMPGMDGVTLIERTRADPALCDIPSILVTSLDSPADRARGLEAGARAYIVKGEFDQRDLLDRIRTLVS